MVFTKSTIYTANKERSIDIQPNENFTLLMATIKTALNNASILMTPDEAIAISKELYKYAENIKMNQLNNG